MEKSQPRPASTSFRLAITAWVCATTPSGSGRVLSMGSQGICPVMKAQGPTETAWLNGATRSGPLSSVWKSMGGGRVIAAS
jgi:hypothetical protein